MALVTAAEVKVIFPTRREDADVGTFIDAAHLIVVEDLPTDLSTERLKLIELYLAAHFLSVSEERAGLTARVVGESEERYQVTGEDRKGLGLTLFGQQAIAMDTSGTLAKLASPPIRAQFRVM